MSLAVRCETKILYVILRQTATALQGLNYGVEREHPLLLQSVTATQKVMVC